MRKNITISFDKKCINCKHKKLDDDDIDSIFCNKLLQNVLDESLCENWQWDKNYTSLEFYKPRINNLSNIENLKNIIDQTKQAFI